MTFPFIITFRHPLASQFSGHNGRHLKSRQTEIGYGWAEVCVCSKIRVSITKRNIWGFSWRKINDISVTALPPPFCSLSGCPGAVWFYTISFTRDCNGWARLKTNRRPIKCKGFLGESPVTGPTTRFTYSQRGNVGSDVLNV